MDISTMRADCARCAALCCVALAFDRSPLFAISKANGEVCPNLGANDRCRIHTRRTQMGFAGCVAYDCLGAGQRVTQEVFGGRSWRQDPARRDAMFRAFATMRRVHELLLLLHEAGRAPLTAGEGEVLRRLRNSLTPEAGWSERTLAAFDVSEAEKEVRAFLATLTPYFDAP
jgi:hypothetical protein